jgi:hypothetical protein
VAIDPSAGAARDASPAAAPAVASVPFAGRVIPDARCVPLDALAHIAVDGATAAQMQREPAVRRAMRLALGRDLQAGDFLALVGVHIATREIADWVWATAWWHDEPDRGPFAADRPTGIAAPWRNYLLSVAFDERTPIESDGGAHVSFNPWLEARFPDGGHGGGSFSNCLACHRRASWPAASFLPVTRGPADVATDPAYAPGRLRTQFLWSIALRARRD